ncbi:MAG: GNAT family protein [Nitrospiraceae bacterium]|nr:GNAT family protein [Nitrospiraceae bacterium]
MLRIKIEKKEGLGSRVKWLKFPFAALPARMEARGIRLRAAWMWGKNCPIRYKIEEKDGGKFRSAGSIGLYNIDFRKSAELALEILEGKRGKGIGKTSLGLFLNGIMKYSFVEELVARVRPGNVPARRLLKGLGFNEEPLSAGPEALKFRLVISSDAGPRASQGR